MKKSRIAKLALLGASAAALAATLSTSTYAWYVSNQKAFVENGTGTTGTAGSDGSILVSWQSSASSDQWFKTISFADAPTEGANKATKGALQPIKYFTGEGAGFYGIDVDGKKDTSANTTNYIQFTVYVKSGKNVSKVTPTVTVSTTAQDTNKGQVAMVGQADGSPVEAGKTFTADAKYAIYTQQNIGTAGNVFTGGKQLSYVAADATDKSSTQNAHDYWEAVAGKTMDTNMGTTSATDAESAVLSDFTLAKDTPLALTYTIFLDGGDTDCFNSCAGWNLTFSLEFSVTGNLTD